MQRSNRLAELDEIKKMYDAIVKIGMSKGNYAMIKNARNVVKRNYDTLEEAYILNNFKVKEWNGTPRFLPSLYFLGAQQNGIYQKP